MIRIAVIDDQTLVRQGIVSLLSLAADLTVVVQAANGAGIVELVQQHQVDVILMDIQMPQVSGIDALHLLNQAQLKVPVIILTTFDDNDRVLQAMQAGARGYLLKDVALELLVDAIHTVHRGGSLLQPAITDKILASFLQRKTDEPSAEDQHAEALSGKELEILRLLATGFSNREIAAAVFKSEGTVKNQVSAILGKLGVRDRTKAVLKAIDLGLLG
jgi:DNA-binding NarL/FixJ family response regulator